MARARLAEPVAPPAPRPERRDPVAPPSERLAFTSLIVSDPPRSRRLLAGVPLSIVTHVVVIVAVILVPILWPEELPDRRDYVRALLYDPPPPPPPPLPKGASLKMRPEPARPVTPEARPDKPAFTAPSDAIRVEPLEPEARFPESQQFGDPSGSELGEAEGMEGGVLGGVVGGVPGGVLGGVIGGTGDIPVPVMDYDRPPRLLRKTKPAYPREAFAKKVEGVVVVEILIDASGHVARARVTQSVPLLDAAALDAVRSWLFEPAIKNGRPVSTLAVAPVSFRIY